MSEKNMLFGYLKRYKWKYFLGIFTLFMVDFAGLYIPQFTGEITDRLEGGIYKKLYELQLK